MKETIVLRFKTNYLNTKSKDLAKQNRGIKNKRKRNAKRNRDSDLYIDT